MGDSTDIHLFRALKYFLYGSDTDRIKSGAARNEVSARVSATASQRRSGEVEAGP